MPQTGLSRREFAWREGFSEGPVRKAIRQGKLVTEQDGSLNPVLVDSGWFVKDNCVRNKPIERLKLVRIPNMKSAYDVSGTHKE